MEDRYKIVEGIIFFLILIISLGIYIMGAINQDTMEITIKDKYVKEGKYFIGTEEGEVFQIRDILILGVFNSSDTYNDINIGSKYEVKVCGFRVRLFSWYRKIIEYKQI